MLQRAIEFLFVFAGTFAVASLWHDLRQLPAHFRRIRAELDDLER